MVTYRCSVKLNCGEYTKDIRNCRNLGEAQHAFSQWMYSEYELDFNFLPVSVVYAVIDTND